MESLEPRKKYKPLNNQPPLTEQRAKAVDFLYHKTREENLNGLTDQEIMRIQQYYLDFLFNMKPSLKTRFKRLFRKKSRALKRWEGFLKDVDVPGEIHFDKHRGDISWRRYEKR